MTSCVRVGVRVGVRVRVKVRVRVRVRASCLRAAGRAGRGGGAVRAPLEVTSGTTVHLQPQALRLQPYVSRLQPCAIGLGLGVGSG